jgi:hypothetical protein
MIEISTTIYDNVVNQQRTSPFPSAPRARDPARDRNRPALQSRNSTADYADGTDGGIEFCRQ